MERIATVIFDGQNLRPEGPIEMKTHARYRIVYDEIADPQRSETRVVPSVITDDGGESAWDVLDRMIGSVKAPPDWSAEHDHYLYGTPKRGDRTEP